MIRTIALCVIVAFLIVGCRQGGPGQGQATPPPPAGSTGAAAGPGANRNALHALPLSVPRTDDLSHADPARFAAALGNDPQRIFTFVRDSIAFESYRGLLRGPRGTLLAAAGNSVDRAALLAAMLEQAGQRVRFARGTLDERHAADLVMSMWAPREASPAGQASNVPSEVKAILDILPAAAGRDLSLIRDRLAALGIQFRQDAVPSLDVLVQETRQHYWVQWSKDGQWSDLDPSFADARPGQTYAKVDETLPALPESLAHQIRIRVKVEEIGDSSASSRVLLTYTAKSAELSAADVVLIHVPENWRGPATSLQGGISEAVANTGRLRPVLLTGAQYVTGEPFFPPGPARGIGSLPRLLRASAPPIAAAEFLELEFVDPSGTADTVIREIYDAVGPARRAGGHSLTVDELQKVELSDLRVGAISLYVTTGKIDPGHVTATVASASASGDDVDLRMLLTAVHVAFAVTSDALTGRTAQDERTDVVFYPNTPRVTILDLGMHGGGPRLRMDLRRTRVRAVALGSHPQDAVLARVRRGVVEGTLERVLMDLWTRAGHGAVFSTSTLFEAAQAEGIATLAFPAERSRLADGVPADALARLEADVAAGYVAVAPQRAPSIDGSARFAWWRIHPASGETTAVTDDGLYSTGVEDPGVRAVSRENAQGARVLAIQTGSAMTGWRDAFVLGAREIQRWGGLPAVLELLRQGGIPLIRR